LADLPKGYFCQEGKSEVMIKHLWKKQEGAVVVIAGILLTVLLGFVGLALDIGNLVLTKTRMQNAVDAAVLAGGILLPNTGQTTRDQANSLITANNFNPVAGQPTFDIDSVLNPDSYPEINYSMTNNVQTFFMGLLGYPNVPITVSAKAIKNIPAAFNYTLFSKDSLSLNGILTYVDGSVHTNDHLSLPGLSLVTGNAEAVNGISKGFLTFIEGQTIPNASTLPMPDYSSQVQAVAATTYSGDQLFTGVTNVNGSMYIDGNVTCQGATLDNSGGILASGNISIDGATYISGSNQVCLYSANGNISIDGAGLFGTNSSSIIYAPNGTVTITGVSLVRGRIIAKSIITSGINLFDGDNHPPTASAVPFGDVKLIK